MSTPASLASRPTARIAGLVLMLLSLGGLYVAWPYIRSELRGTWLLDLRFVIFAVYVVLALSLLHPVERWIAARMGGSG